MHERTYLYFLVPGQTKNVCDGAFGHVKRRLQHREAHVPVDMMQVIEESSVSTRCIPSQKVEWRNWKKHITALFLIPSRQTIMCFHLSVLNLDIYFRGRTKILLWRKIFASYQNRDLSMFIR